MIRLSLFTHLVRLAVVVGVLLIVDTANAVSATGTATGTTSTGSDIVNVNANVNDKVQVELYYESQCPGCREMITTSFYDAYQKDGFLDMVDVTFIPYGNAQESPGSDDDTLYDFKCQHGPSECIFNIIETCALNKIQCPYAKFEFINCIENNDENRNVDQDYEKIALNCAIKINLNDTVVEEIKMCSVSKEGNELEHDMAVKTESLNPPHTYVPYVVVNGVHSDDIQTDITDSVFDYVCKTYMGTNKSSNCPSPTTSATTTFGFEEKEDNKDNVVCYRSDHHADFNNNKNNVDNDNDDDDVIAATTTTAVLRRRQRLM
jgi:interferon gamma-inducible protein 30